MWTLLTCGLQTVNTEYEKDMVVAPPCEEPQQMTFPSRPVEVGRETKRNILVIVRETKKCAKREKPSECAGCTDERCRSKKAGNIDPRRDTQRPTKLRVLHNSNGV